MHKIYKKAVRFKNHNWLIFLIFIIGVAVLLSTINERKETGTKLGDFKHQYEIGSVDDFEDECKEQSSKHLVVSSLPISNCQKTLTTCSCYTNGEVVMNDSFANYIKFDSVSDGPKFELLTRKGNCQNSSNTPLIILRNDYFFEPNKIHFLNNLLAPLTGIILRLEDLGFNKFSIGINSGEKNRKNSWFEIIKYSFNVEYVESFCSNNFIIGTPCEYSGFWSTHAKLKRRSWLKIKELFNSFFNLNSCTKQNLNDGLYGKKILFISRKSQKQRRNLIDEDLLMSKIQANSVEYSSNNHQQIRCLVRQADVLIVAHGVEISNFLFLKNWNNTMIITLIPYAWQHGKHTGNWKFSKYIFDSVGLDNTDIYSIPLSTCLSEPNGMSGPCSELRMNVDNFYDRIRNAIRKKFIFDIE